MQPTRKGVDKLVSRVFPLERDVDGLKDQIQERKYQVKVVEQIFD